MRRRRNGRGSGGVHGSCRAPPDGVQDSLDGIAWVPRQWKMQNLGEFPLPHWRPLRRNSFHCAQLRFWRITWQAGGECYAIHVPAGAGGAARPATSKPPRAARKNQKRVTIAVTLSGSNLATHPRSVFAGRVRPTRDFYFEPICAMAAFIRSIICASVRSSLCVAIPHAWPNGSVTWPYRSPQN